MVDARERAAICEKLLGLPTLWSEGERQEVWVEAMLTQIVSMGAKDPLQDVKSRGGSLFIYQGD